MVTAENNLRAPDGLLDQARPLAEGGGCTADELASALKLHMQTRQNVQELRTWLPGENKMRECGDSSDPTLNGQLRTCGVPGGGSNHG